MFKLKLILLLELSMKNEVIKKIKSKAAIESGIKPLSPSKE